MSSRDGSDRTVWDESGTERDEWDVFVARQAGVVWAVPRGLGLRTQTAVEVAHTAWLRVVERLDRLAPDDLPAALAAAAREEAVRAARWQGGAAPAAPTSEALLTALEHLPSRQRLALRVLAATPPADERTLAAALDVPSPAVAEVVEQALDRLADGVGDATSTQELPARLRDAVTRTDPTPAALSAAARAAFSWRTLAAELAPLDDAGAHDDALAGVRGGPPDRQLSFRAPGLVVDLQVSASGERRDLVGQLTPAGPVPLELRRPSGAVALEVDDLGRFTCDGLDAGPFSLVVRRDDGLVVHTQWTAL